jgi:hypothetical protein
VQSLQQLLEWLQGTSLALYIHHTKWAFTTIKLIHASAISLVIGSIALVDLRLLGVAFTSRPFTDLASRALRWTWAAFAIAVVAGSLLFISEATDYFTNTMFRIKMVALVVAGINMLIFELMTVRGVQAWDIAASPPPSARLAGAISLACWLLIVVAGRWTGFTLMPA